MLICLQSWPDTEFRNKNYRCPTSAWKHDEIQVNISLTENQKRKSLQPKSHISYGVSYHSCSHGTVYSASKTNSDMRIVLFRNLWSRNKVPDHGYIFNWNKISPKCFNGLQPWSTVRGVPRSVLSASVALQLLVQWKCLLIKVLPKMVIAGKSLWMRHSHVIGTSFSRDFEL